MRDRRRSLGLGMLVVAAAVAAGCGGVAPGADSDRRGEGPATVRVYLAAEPASLSLIGKTDSNSEIIATQVTDSLVQYDAALELQPRLAESWELSADRKVLTMHLRTGVRWHDGAPLTADDVVFTVNKVREPATENRTWGPQFRDVTSVEAVDPSTVRASYSVASPDFLEAWRLPILPRHLAGRDPDLLTGEFSRHPVGCGPFRFVRRSIAGEIVLEANDDYWDGRPQIDRLIFRVFADQRTAYQSLLTGDLDIMHMTTSLWEEARSSERGKNLKSTVFHRLSVWHIAWNQDGSNPFFDDARVRRAMILGLDRDRFNKGVLGGLARKGLTTYHPDTRWADPRLEPWPYDPSAARRLLAQSGWSDSDGDGVLDRDGRPFEFSLMIPVSSQKLVDHMAAWQQESWAELGIRTLIEKLEFQTFRERRNSGRFDAAEAAFNFTANPDQYELYHSSARDGGFNFFGLADDEVDRLLEQARSTFDDAERVRLYRQLQARLHELEPLSCLYHFATPVLYRPRLSGVRTSPIGYLTMTEGPRLWSVGDAGAD